MILQLVITSSFLKTGLFTTQKQAEKNHIYSLMLRTREKYEFSASLDEI